MQDGDWFIVMIAAMTVLLIVAIALAVVITLGNLA